MRFQKLYSRCFFMLLSICLWNLSAVLPANAQKKDNPKKTLQVEPAPITPYSNVKRESLLNGLLVTSIERAGDSTVKCDLIIRTGAMFDQVGKTGLAALTLETLLIVNPRLKEELESLDAKIEWQVNWDTTWFSIETPASNFDPTLEILARLLVVENVRTEAFKNAQQAVLTRIKSRQLSSAHRADELFLKALYGEHPYGHSVEGSEESIAGIKQGDVYDFLKRFYLSNNVSAVIAGNISHERATKAFKVFFGGWIKGQTVPATFRPPAQITQLRLVKIDEPEITNVEIRGGLLGVRHTDPDFPITEVIAKILAAKVRKEAESMASAFMVKADPRILPGPVSFSATVSAEQAPAFSRAVTEAFAALATTPLSGEDLAAAKSSLAGEYSARPVDFFLREIETYSLPRSYPLKISEKIESISAADVQRVAKKLLAANALTVLVLGRVNEIKI